MLEDIDDILDKDDLNKDLADMDNYKPNRQSITQFEKGNRVNPLGNQFGRPPGKVPSGFEFRTKLKEMGFDAIKEMVDLAKNSRYDKDRIQATAHILNRVYPTLKAIEISGDVGTTFQLNVIKAADSIEAKRVEDLSEEDSKEAS